MREVIQERDKSILRTGYEEQFLALKMISKYYFGSSFQSASARIKKLVSMRLLKYELLALPGKPKVVRLTQSGVRLIRVLSPFEIKQKRRVPLSTFTHDLNVTETRLRLAELFDATWIPEKALKVHPFKKIPDGILLFQSGKRIAIEVENSIKSKERYVQMWREWENHDFVLVLYVATTDAVYRTLERQMGAFQTTKVRFGLIRFLGLLRPTPDAVWTPRGNVALFGQRSF